MARRSRVTGRKTGLSGDLALERVSSVSRWKATVLVERDTLELSPVLNTPPRHLNPSCASHLKRDNHVWAGRQGAFRGVLQNGSIMECVPQTRPHRRVSLSLSLSRRLFSHLECRAFFLLRAKSPARLLVCALSPDRSLPLAESTLGNAGADAGPNVVCNGITLGSDRNGAYRLRGDVSDFALWVRETRADDGRFVRILPSLVESGWRLVSGFCHHLESPMESRVLSRGALQVSRSCPNLGSKRTTRRVRNETHIHLLWLDTQAGPIPAGCLVAVERALLCKHGLPGPRLTEVQHRRRSATE